MKAIMRDNLVERYKSVMPKEYDAEIGAFLRSIEGKEVELRFVGTDAFEVNDNSIWLPDCLWDECTSNPSCLGPGHLVAGTQHNIVGRPDSESEGT